MKYYICCSNLELYSYTIRTFDNFHQWKRPISVFLMLAKRMEYEGKKKKYLLKLANIWYITKPLLGAEAVTRRYTKFTVKSICRSLFFNKVAGMSTVTLIKRDSVAGVFFWIFAVFKNTCFEERLWLTYWFVNYIHSRVMTYGFIVSLNMHVKGTKRARKTRVYKSTQIVSIQMCIK